MLCVDAGHKAVDVPVRVGEHFQGFSVCFIVGFLNIRGILFHHIIQRNEGRIILHDIGRIHHTHECVGHIGGKQDAQLFLLPFTCRNVYPFYMDVGSLFHKLHNGFFVSIRAGIKGIFAAGNAEGHLFIDDGQP